MKEGGVIGSSESGRRSVGYINRSAGAFFFLLQKRATVSDPAKTICLEPESI